MYIFREQVYVQIYIGKAWFPKLYSVIPWINNASVDEAIINAIGHFFDTN